MSEPQDAINRSEEVMRRRIDEYLGKLFLGPDPFELLILRNLLEEYQATALRVPLDCNL